MKKLIIPFLLILSGCRLDILQAKAEGETYVTYKMEQEQWDYAARVLPVELMRKVRSEILAGEHDAKYEPDRFSAIALKNPRHKTMYIFTWQTHCMDEETCNKYDEDVERFYPGCMGRAGCNYTVYVKERGKYRVLTGFAFFRYGQIGRFLQVSTERVEKGYPKCFRLMGYDGNLQWPDHRFHQRYDPDQPLLSTYCYDKSQSHPDEETHYHLKDVQPLSKDFSI